MFTTIVRILLLTTLNPSTGAILRKKSAAKYGQESIGDLQRIQEALDQYRHDDSFGPSLNHTDHYKNLKSNLENLEATNKLNKKSDLLGKYSPFDYQNSQQGNDDNIGEFNNDHDKIVVFKGIEVGNGQNLKEIVDDLLSKHANKKINNIKEVALETPQRNLHKKYNGVYGPPTLRGNDGITLNEMITNFEYIKDQAVYLFKKHVVGNGNVNDILKFLPKEEKAVVKQIHGSFHKQKHNSKPSLTPQDVEKHVRDILYGEIGENIIKPSADKDQNVIFVPKALYKSILNAKQLAPGSSQERLFNPLKFKRFRFLL